MGSLLNESVRLGGSIMYAYLWERLNQLEQEIRRLKKENKEIKEQIATIKPLVVEHLEYKIQELDIQTLSGTLNVGLTAHGDEKSIEDMINKMMQEENMKFNLGETNTNNQLSIDDSSDSSQSSSHPSSPRKNKGD